MSETFLDVNSCESAETLDLIVRTCSQRVAAFKEETFSTLPGIPLTFPFCWLTLPEVRAKINAVLGSGQLPLHETQNFAVEHSLLLDEDYIFRTVFQRLENPFRLSIHASVRQGDIVFSQFETLLRILPLAGDAA